MATKQPLKAVKPSSKASQPTKKVSAKKVFFNNKVNSSKVAGKQVAKSPGKQGKKVAAVEGKKVSPQSGKNTAALQKKGSAALKKVAKAPNQVTKVAKAIKDAAKKVIKKTQAIVKKTPDKKAPEKVSQVTKVTAPEKKTLKTAAPTEKVKPVKAEPVKAEPPVKEIKPQKLVVVPSKPLANPAPVAEKKSDTPRSNKPVVIPKTSTDKKVDYEPDFTKSVLDAPAVVPSGPTMRYSDAELQEFRDLINKKLDAAKKELAYLQGLITRRDEMGGDETDNRYMTMEDGGMSMEREQLSQMASRQITFIDHLEKAIMRIENKTYGICRVTGKLIDKARLRAVPHATLSMEAKLGITR
jgi:RNA polymerase-binding transcription factor DksA